MPPDEDYRRRIQFIQNVQRDDPAEYLLFCARTTHLAATNKLPDHMRKLRDDLARCIRSSSHRPLTLDTPQWANDEWMRDLWFDLFGPEPAPGDPYPVPRDDWGSIRWTSAMRTLATHDAHPGSHLHAQTATWCRIRQLTPSQLMTTRGTDADANLEHRRPEPTGYRDRLRRYVAEGTRPAVPGEQWYAGTADLAALVAADNHDIWWAESKRLQAIADEAAASLRVASPLVVHLCPEERFERGRAARGGPASIASIRPDRRLWPRASRRFRLALPRHVATQSNQVTRGIIGREVARLARIDAPGRRWRRAAVVAVYLATVIALNAVQIAFSLSTWQALPIVIPCVLAVLAWHSWLKRREGLADDVLAASIGMPLTDDAAAWIEQRQSGHLPRPLRWLGAPFRETASWPRRLEAIHRAAPSPEHSLTT